MTEITVRQISSDEALEIFYPGNAYSFAASPPLRDKEEWQGFIRSREGVTFFALYEDGKAVSTAAGSPLEQNVRGKIFPMAGIWAVVTHAGARRKGYSRDVMAHLLRSLRELDNPFTCLYPFRESFYERLGYATFPLPKVAKFSPHNLEPLLKEDLGGEIEMLLSTDHFESYLDFIRSMQVKVHGMSQMIHMDRAANKRFPTWLAFAIVDGVQAGMIAYRLSGDSPTQFKMEIFRFYYHSAQGKYLLLQWIARHSDQASEVSVTLPAFEQPETWLPDIQVKTESAVRAPMGRVLDVADIGGMHVNSGIFTARVSDSLCPWNEGVWRFESMDGSLQVSRAKNAECEISIQALSALIYGTHDPADFPYRGWGNPSGQTQEMMRSMFPAAIPHLHEYF
jgi:predicted acetyltransferase